MHTYKSCYLDMIFISLFLTGRRNDAFSTYWADMVFHENFTGGEDYCFETIAAWTQFMSREEFYTANGWKTQYDGHP